MIDNRKKNVNKIQHAFHKINWVKKLSITNAFLDSHFATLLPHQQSFPSIFSLLFTISTSLSLHSSVDPFCFATNATHCVTSTAHCASSAALWAIGSFSLRHQPQPWSHQHRSIGPLLSGSKVDEVITLESRRGRQWRWRSLSPLLYYIKISWIGSMETRFHLSP